MLSKNIIKFLNSATAVQVKAYLELNGWIKNVDFNNKNLDVYNKSDYSLVIPAKESYIDFKPKLYNSLKALSSIYEKEITELLKDIKSVSSDTIRFRLISELYEDGSIPLNHATTIIRAIKNLIITSACTEENPRPYFKATTKSASKYGNAFKFAQTEIGSFIINIETNDIYSQDSPIQRVISNDLSICDEVPFERRIVDRIAIGLNQISNFNEYESIEEFIDTAYIDGVNANMCESLLEFKNVNESFDIESSFVLSKLCETTKDYSSTIKLTNSSFHIIETISKAYRDVQITEKIDLIGKVDKVNYKHNQPLDFGGYATIEFIDSNNRIKKAKAYLENEYYKIACDALKERKDIHIRGIIDKTNRSWHIEEIDIFKLLNT